MSLSSESNLVSSRLPSSCTIQPSQPKHMHEHLDHAHTPKHTPHLPAAQPPPEAPAAASVPPPDPTSLPQAPSVPSPPSAGALISPLADSPAALRAAKQKVHQALFQKKKIRGAHKSIGNATNLAAKPFSLLKAVFQRALELIPLQTPHPPCYQSHPTQKLASPPLTATTPRAQNFPLPTCPTVISRSSDSNLVFVHHTSSCTNQTRQT